MKKYIAVLSLIFSITFIGSQTIFADEAEEEKSPFSLFLQTEAAYYPETKRVTGGDHFAPLTGFYSGVEARTTLGANYKIDTPLGENWLVSGANVVLGGGLELTPVSLRPLVSVGFTPVPFLVFEAGASVGWGWNLGPFEGICAFNKETGKYEKLSTFAHPYYDVWGSVTFQFDTGALIPGDWTHVVILASYTTTYSGIAGLDQDTIFEWQCGKNKARGLQYVVQGVLGYQMPLPLSLTGVMFGATGYYDGKAYGEFDANYDGSFAKISISPFLQFKFGDKDDLYCLFDFASRRSFNAEFEELEEALYLKKTGREWFFNRIAFSWTHKFM